MGVLMSTGKGEEERMEGKKEEKRGVVETTQTFKNKKVAKQTVMMQWDITIMWGSSGLFRCMNNIASKGGGVDKGGGWK